MGRTTCDPIRCRLKEDCQHRLHSIPGGGLDVKYPWCNRLRDECVEACFKDDDCSEMQDSCLREKYTARTLGRCGLAVNGNDPTNIDGVNLVMGCSKAFFQLF